MAIAERLRQLLREQQITERELSRRAGLAESHVGLLLARLDADPLAVELRTLDKVARAAGVSVAWLVAGGEDRRAGAGPARDEAARLAEAEGLWPEAIRSVLAGELGEADSDRPVEWWLLRIKMRELEMIAEAKRRDAERGAQGRGRAATKKRTKASPERDPQELPPPAQTGQLRKVERAPAKRGGSA